MKLAIAILALSVSGVAIADEYVNGYVRKDGTYVAPHFRSSPNSTKLDNYSTQGNVNPYTGQRGYEQPLPSYTPPPVYHQPQPMYQPLPPVYGTNRGAASTQNPWDR